MLTDGEKTKLVHRLHRINGQVTGIENMILDGRYCIDILRQIAAAKGALERVGNIILESHSRSCVVEHIKDGRDEEAIDELMSVINALYK